jgi:hypothetical protein
MKIKYILYRKYSTKNYETSFMGYETTGFNYGPTGLICGVE